MNCLNAFCENELTQYEIERQSRRSMRYHLCKSCRGRSINSYKCRECGITFAGRRSIYCIKCCRKKRSQYIYQWFKDRRVPKPTVQGKIIELLESNQYVFYDEIAGKINSSQKTVKVAIHLLRKKNYKIRTMPVLMLEGKT